MFPFRECWSRSVLYANELDNKHDTLDAIAVRSQSKCLVQKNFVQLETSRLLQAKGLTELSSKSSLCCSCDKQSSSFFYGKALCLGGCLDIGVCLRLCLGEDYKCTKSHKYDKITNLNFARISPGFLLKIHPDFARIFTKMSPDEELVSLHIMLTY